MQVASFSRRKLLLSLGVAAQGFFLPSPTHAFSNFWENKEVADWSESEILQLSTKSPWAKQVDPQLRARGGRRSAGAPSRVGSMGRVGGGMPGGGLSGAPGTGGSADMDGVVPRIAPVTVRWESAQPMLLALKTTLPKDMEGHYVISVSGLPTTSSHRRQVESGGPQFLRSQQNNESSKIPRSATESEESSENTSIEDIMTSTTLQSKGKDPLQPGVVTRPKNSSAFFFAFSKELLPLESSDKDLMFTTHVGPILIKARFEPKSMMFRGQFAI